jgi:hypothetical protein
MRNVAHASSALRSKKSAQLDEASNQIAPAPQTLLKTTRPIPCRLGSVAVGARFDRVD